MRFRHIVKLILLTQWIMAMNVATAVAVTDPCIVRVGVLAEHGPESSKSKWGPTAHYLTGGVPPCQFEIVPLDMASVTGAVRDKKVAFILTNASAYVFLEKTYGVKSIATLVHRTAAGDHTLLGATILTRADEHAILTIKDLHGRDFMAVEETSMGGWQMAWREIKAAGLDPYRDFASLSFAGSNDDVVLSVQNHDVDAGTVPAGTLEGMAAQGKINLSRFRILNVNEGAEEDTGLASSTRLYPGWSMAVLPHTPTELAEKVARALFRLEDGHAASIAANSGGWSYPLSYDQVHECLRDLQWGPYDTNAKTSLRMSHDNYQKWFVFNGIAVFAIFLCAIYLFKLNNRLSAVNTDLVTEIKTRNTIETGLIESEFNLRSALAAASEANDSKADFLANMSHELRTPMNGIIGMASILKETQLADDQREFVQIIMKSSEGLLGIINDILDYSQIKAKKSRLDMTDFDLCNLAKEVVRQFSQGAKDKGLVFSHMIAEDIPHFLIGDARRIKKIIRILMSNALKFTQQGAVSLQIGHTETTDSHCTILVEVKDTGIGIPPGREELIFNPFSQVDYSSTRKYGGTGIGLALAKHFAEMMGGAIGFRSTPSMGSTFWFTVNLEKQTTIEPKKRYKTVDINDKRILIVDDEPTNRQVLEGYLKSWHLEYTAVGNARAALAALHQAATEKAPFHLAIIDHMMPEMDGVDLGRAIKSEPMLKGLKMVLLTGMDQWSDPEAIKALGFNAFITSPIRSTELFNCLKLVYRQLEDTSRAPSAPRALITRKKIEEVKADGPHVLVVEDNATNKMVLLNILKGNGCRASAVDSGRKAVSALCQEDYDLVLMDLQLPEMNGFEATSAIRNPYNQCLNPNIPIIAVTANITRGERQNCLDAGMDDYLPKPVDGKALMEKIHQWYGSRQIRTDSKTGAPN